MTKPGGVSIGCLAMLVWGLASATAGAQAPTTGIAVSILNRAQLDAAVVNAVQADVSRVFQAVGIHVTWLHEHTGAIPTPWLLVVIDRTASSGVGIGRAVLGYAQRAGGEADGIAFVFRDRAEKVSRQEGQTLAPVLAYAVAHEIGHLLLGPEAHSARGIMQGRWDRTTLLASAQGSLYFSHDQGARMRERLAAAARLENHRAQASGAVR